MADFNVSNNWKNPAYFANLALVTGDWQWKTYSGVSLANLRFQIRAIPWGSISEFGFLRYEALHNSGNLKIIKLWLINRIFFIWIEIMYSLARTNLSLYRAYFYSNVHRKRLFFRKRHRSVAAELVLQLLLYNQMQNRSVVHITFSRRFAKFCQKTQ